MEVREITFKSAILDKRVENLILDALGEVCIRFVFAQVFKRQNRDRAFDFSERLRALIQPGTDCDRTEKWIAPAATMIDRFRRERASVRNFV